MTEPATTIPTQAGVRREISGAEHAVPDFGAALAFGGAFAELLSAASGIGAAGAEIGGGTTEAESRGGAASDANGERADDVTDEGGDGPGERVDRAQKASDQAAGLAVSTPMTIRSLNRLLLSGNGAESKLTQASGNGGLSGSAAAEDLGVSKRSEASGQGSVGKQEGKSAGTPAPVEASREHGPATGPVAVAAKAGEGAQGTAALPNGRAQAPGNGAVNVAGVGGVQAVAAGVARAAAGDGSSSSQGGSRGGHHAGTLPLSGGSFRAQGIYGGARGVRDGAALSGGMTTEARAEAFQAQLARGMTAAMEKGRGTLTLHLKPEALGQVHVRVSMKDGVLTARFQAETPEARDLLLSTAGELRGSLEAAGVSVERIEASVSPRLRSEAQEDTGASGNGHGGASEGDGSPGRDDSGSSSGRRGRDAAVQEGDDAAEPRADGGDGGDGGDAGKWLVLGLDTVA